MTNTLPVGDMNEPVQALRSTKDVGVDGAQEASSRHGDSLLEGDLVTGTINIANDRAYMVVPHRNMDKGGKNGAVVRVCLPLTGRPTHITSTFLPGEIPPLVGNYPARI